VRRPTSSRLVTVQGEGAETETQKEYNRMKKGVELHK
jgi:hypothetical protein